MGEDTFYLFIIVVGLTAIVMPGIGELIIGLFGFTLGVTALLFPSAPRAGQGAPPRRHHAAGS